MCYALLEFHHMNVFSKKKKKKKKKKPVGDKIMWLISQVEILTSVLFVQCLLISVK